MVKKKVLIVLSSRYYIKYLTLNSFQNLKKKYDLSFALKKNSFNDKKI